MLKISDNKKNTFISQTSPRSQKSLFYYKGKFLIEEKEGLNRGEIEPSKIWLKKRRDFSHDRLTSFRETKSTLFAILQNFTSPPDPYAELLFKIFFPKLSSKACHPLSL